MSAATKLIPDPLPLHVEGGRRFIGHPVALRDFPPEYRPIVREVWDVLIERDFEDVTILPDNLTDLVLKQLAGRCARGIQEGLYYLELGASACRTLASIERRLRGAATDEDRARACAELVAFRAARQDIKDRYHQLTARMVMIRSKPDPTDEDRARLAELAAERDGVRTELEADDALIFRHSGPGMLGRRQIEIVARLAGEKKGKGGRRPAAGTKAPAGQSKGTPIPNVGIVPETPPELAAAVKAQRRGAGRPDADADAGRGGAKQAGMGRAPADAPRDEEAAAGGPPVRARSGHAPGRRAGPGRPGDHRGQTPGHGRPDRPRARRYLVTGRARPDRCG